MPQHGPLGPWGAPHRGRASFSPEDLGALTQVSGLVTRRQCRVSGLRLSPKDMGVSSDSHLRLCAGASPPKTGTQWCLRFVVAQLVPRELEGYHPGAPRWVPQRAGLSVTRRQVPHACEQTDVFCPGELSCAHFIQAWSWMGDKFLSHRETQGTVPRLDGPAGQPGARVTRDVRWLWSEHHCPGGLGCAWPTSLL